MAIVRGIDTDYRVLILNPKTKILYYSPSLGLYQVEF